MKWFLCLIFASQAFSQELTLDYKQGLKTVLNRLRDNDSTILKEYIQTSHNKTVQFELKTQNLILGGSFSGSRLYFKERRADLNSTSIYLKTDGSLNLRFGYSNSLDFFRSNENLIIGSVNIFQISSSPIFYEYNGFIFCSHLQFGLGVGEMAKTEFILGVRAYKNISLNSSFYLDITREMSSYKKDELKNFRDSNTLSVGLRYSF